MHIFAVRHGETDYNKKGLIMGARIDAPLNKTGKEQARSLIPELKKHNFEMIYVSPMLRTHQTAEIISAELNLPAEEHKDLVERNVGDLAGKPYSEVSKIIGKDSYEGGEYDYRPHGGESSEQVLGRVKSFIDYATKRHAKHNDAGKKLLVVTHSGIIRLLYEHFNQPVAQSIHNVCVHEF